MIDPAVLPGFLAAVTLVTLAPGPDNVYIAAVALQRGARAGVVSALGMSVGMTVHVGATALGLAVLLHSNPWTLTVIQLAGALYLARLSWTTLRPKPDDSSGRPIPQGRILERAIVTNLTNPKVILFFAAFLPTFVVPSRGALTPQLLELGLIFLLIGLACDSAIGVVAGRVGRAVAPDGRGATLLTQVAGLTFAVLAALLLVDAVGRLR